MHETLDEFKFQPDTTTNSELSALARLKKMIYNVVNTLAPLFFYRICFIFAGNKDNNKMIYNVVNTLAPSFFARLKR